MTSEEYIANVERVIAQCEDVYFTGCFSESFIKNDLESRRTLDMIRRNSGRGSDEESMKKRFYLEDFDNREEFLDDFLRQMQVADFNPNHPWVMKFERIKNQIVRLRDIVRNF